MYKELLIGTDIKVTEAGNKDLIGIEGRIVDETRNTLIISTPKGRKTIVKDQVVFEARKGGQTLIIDGKSIMRRPYDRIR
ncbi:ribonuclease P protein subunit [Candidatus Woesearchaeota archaeon]|nr:ribonuclease P protein subunit [Candidatus Woesearchaeota archaeon]